jgi:hypothetical protein
MIFPKPVDGSFPKVCSNCGKSFDSMISFYQETRALQKHGSIKGRGKILLPRNCLCGTTLTISIVDKRDLSKEGEEKRSWVGAEIQRIMSTITTDYFTAKKLALINFEKLISENQK